MKNGRFEPKDKSFSKRDKEKSETGNCSYSSFVTLILGPSGLATLKVTLMTLSTLLHPAVHTSKWKGSAWHIQNIIGGHIYFYCTNVLCLKTRQIWHVWVSIVLGSSSKSWSKHLNSVLNGFYHNLLSVYKFAKDKPEELANHLHVRTYMQNTDTYCIPNGILATWKVKQR